MKNGFSRLVVTLPGSGGVAHGAGSHIPHVRPRGGLAGFKEDAPMGKRALIVIDVQNDYFPGGVWALPHAEAALPNILRLIEAARGRGEPVAFIQHVAPAESHVFAKGSPGGQLHDALPRHDGDPLIEKAHPSAFMGTGLEAWLKETGIAEVDICGFMTQMCCDTTTRVAYEKGYPVRLFADACAARDVTHGGETIPHHLVHAAHLGSLARFAQVLTTSEGK